MRAQTNLFLIKLSNVIMSLKTHGHEFKKQQNKARILNQEF